jgi:hypothetical protein
VHLTPLRGADPAQVGPHRLLGRLGQGGMGTVYLGVSPDERAVAVKVLRDGLTDADARRRFRYELDALRRVRGPHVVEVLDADVDAETPYLVTRFVPGRRLDELVGAAGPLAGAALLQAAHGIADALVTLHAAGVVHRDLSPGNVLLLDGTPQVIDLGLAVAADVTALTRSGLVLGTPGYLSPEQVLGHPATAAADVHAWGATVALAATGRPPYGTGRPEAVLYRIVHGEPDLHGLPAPLDRLVPAAMSREPADRPTAEALVAALGGPSTTRPPDVRLPHDVAPTDVLDTDLLTTQRLEGLRLAPAAVAADRTAPQRAAAGAGLPPATGAGEPTTALLPAAAPVGAAAPATALLDSPGAPPDRSPARRGAGSRQLTPTRELPVTGARYDDAPLRDRPDSDRLDPDRPDDARAHDDRYDDDRYDDERAYDDRVHDRYDVDRYGASRHPDATEPPASSPARTAQVALTGVAALGVVGAGALLAPVVAVATVLVLLVLLRGLTRCGARLRNRRERRGGRRRDPFVALVSSPWHLALAALDTLVSLPLLAAAAALPAGAVWLADPVVDGHERLELAVAAGLVAATVAALARPPHAGSRRLLRRALVTATPGPVSGLAVLLVAVATAVVLLAGAEGGAPVWWPLPR